MQPSNGLIKISITEIGYREKKVVIGTAKGDIHDIVKNVARDLIKAAEFEVYDLGVDVTYDHFVNKIREVSPNIVGISGLLETLHNLEKIAIFCNLWNNNLANSPQMSLGSTILNQEVHGDGVETVILDCRKSG